MASMQGALAGAPCHICNDRGVSEPLFPKSQLPAAILLVGAIFFACFFNPSYGPTPHVLQSSYALAAALLWMLLRPVSIARAAGWLALAFVLAACANGAMAIFQYFGLIERSNLFVSGSAVGEAYGNLRQRNQLASLLAIGLASAWYLRARAPQRLASVALALSVVLISVASALTSSRTGLLQWVILCGLAFLAPWRAAPGWWRRWALLAALSYALALLLVPPLVVAMTGESPTTLGGRLNTELGCVSRKVLWSNALYLIGQHPWVGWGLGAMDYAHHVTLYPGERFCLIVDNAHNLFLQVGVELGLPAALLLFAAVVLAVVWGRPWRERVPHRQLAWAILGLIMLHSMVEYPLWYGPFQLAFVLAAALLWRHESDEGPVPWRQPHRRILAVLGVSVMIFVLLDYDQMTQLYLPDQARHAGYRGTGVEKAYNSVLFKAQVEFGDFTITPITPENAASRAQMGERVMYYSPEPRVIKQLVTAWLLQGRTERAAWHLERMCVAFESDWLEWLKERPDLAKVAPDRCPKADSAAK